MGAEQACPTSVNYALSRGCAGTPSKVQGDAAALFAHHVYLSDAPSSHFSISKVAAETWVEDHEVAVRMDETHVDVPPHEWRILHFDDLIVQRCTRCSHEYLG